MRVMLTKDVEDLGRAGEVKEVADGFARNFLLRRKLAVAAHKGVEAEAKRLWSLKGERGTYEKLAESAKRGLRISAKRNLSRRSR